MDCNPCTWTCQTTLEKAKFNECCELSTTNVLGGKIQCGTGMTCSDEWTEKSTGPDPNACFKPLDREKLEAKIRTCSARGIPDSEKAKCKQKMFPKNSYCHSTRYNEEYAGWAKKLGYCVS